MQTILTNLFLANSLSAAQGCNEPELLLNAVFESLTGLAYFAIALFLIYFVRKGSHNKIWLLLAVVLFVCSTAQVAKVWMLWHPIYWLLGFVKATISLMSLLAAIIAIAQMKKALAESSLERGKNLQQQPKQDEESPQGDDLDCIQQPELAQESSDIYESDTIVDRTAEINSLNEQLQKEIAARQRAEQKLQLTQFAMDRSADSVFWIGSDAKFLYVNNAACSSLGYSAAELLSMNLHDINPDFPETAWNLHWNVLKRCGSVKIEVHHITKYGRIFPVEITINHLKFNDQEYQCAFARDISDRKRIEAALLAREQEFRSLVSNIPGAVYRCSPEGRYALTFISSGIEVIAGYPATNFLLKPVQDFASIVHPDDRDFINKIIAISVKAKQSYMIEYRLIHLDGNVRWVAEKGQAIFGESGQVLSLNGVIFDITERKESEDALRLSEAIAKNRAQ
jgi:two-component system, NtrC family, sensor kinase